MILSAADRPQLEAWVLQYAETGLKLSVVGTCQGQPAVLGQLLLLTGVQAVALTLQLQQLQDLVVLWLTWGAQVERMLEGTNSQLIPASYIGNQSKRLVKVERESFSVVMHGQAREQQHLQTDNSRSR